MQVCPLASSAALPCSRGCTGAHRAGGGCPEEPHERSRAVEAATERPQLTTCAPGCCGRFSPPPLCSPSRRRPWWRLRRRLGRTCRWRLSAPRPLHILAASSSPLTLDLPPAGSCLARGRRLAARPGTRWASPTCARMAAPSTSGCARRRCEQQLPCNPRSRSAEALRCARPVTDQARAGVHGGVGWLPRPGVRAPLQRLPVQDA